jgi:hypothetical protein
MFSASSGIVTPRFSHDNSTIESCNLIIGETFGLGQDGDIVPSFFLSFMFQAFSLECQAILDRYSISRLGSIPHFPSASNLYFSPVNIEASVMRWLAGRSPSVFSRRPSLGPSVWAYVFPSPTYVSCDVMQETVANHVGDISFALSLSLSLAFSTVVDCL